MLRRAAVLATTAALAVGVPHAGAAVKPAPKPTVKLPVVALIDSGARASSHEFDYRGKASTTDQIVGWWDFTSQVKGKVVLPTAGQTWDTQVSDPYDKIGHGTLTASMVGGLSASSVKTPAAYPGCKLAIAQVTEPDATIPVANEAAAIRWATSVVHADVISISIGTVVPAPALLYSELFDAIRAARQAGILVVIANGNGFGGYGLVPGDPGWAGAASASTDALTVGAMNSTGLLNSTDPEVAAVYGITGPSNADDTSYVSAGGTSFGTPYVAGFAAAVILASRQGGHPMSVSQLELFVKRSATDTLYPVQIEGYGQLTQKELPAALANAKAGKTPVRPSPDVSALYVEDVAGTLRTAWTVGS